MYLREGVVCLFGVQRKYRCVNPPDARQRQSCSPAIFSYANDAAFAAAFNENQALAATANTDDAAGLDHVVQPLLKHLGASLRQRLAQTRACAGQSLQPAHRRRRQIATGGFKLGADSLLALITRSLKFTDALHGFAMRETSFRDLAHLLKIAEGVQQIQERGVGGAKLA